MIRWYDYVAAFVFADFLLGFFLASLTASGFWGTFFFGFMIFVAYDLWCDVYCKIRLKMEMKNDNKL